MSRTPSEIIQALVKDPTNTDLVNTLVAQDATYVSLNHKNLELKQIMPWAGTSQGPGAIVDRRHIHKSRPLLAIRERRSMTFLKRMEMSLSSASSPIKRR